MPLALSRASRQSVGVRWIRGDLSMPQNLSAADVSVIYCTAEIGLLADALPYLMSASLKRVVAFTSTSIVTKIESEIPAERELLQRLADGERRLIATCERLGIGWTILRPTLIYAEGRDGNVSRLARLIGRFGVLPLMGSGAGLRQPVHAQDLAIGALRAAASAAAANKIYALPGGETLSYREMAGRVFDALGRPRRIFRRRHGCGGSHLLWPGRSSPTPMWQWVTAWPRTCCSTSRRRWPISAGRRAASAPTSGPGSHPRPSEGRFPAAGKWSRHC
ncbi:epimerase [Rhodopseudomonas sp. P2A-2r]|uniref:SDR family oxidoreductase n=1 Tax=Rhodopseudomonas sp. P2A-2r TaxID=2991972 RepID=UPI0029FF2E32|nr:epimerase [Rhodopseudomonas sp. P2A-2r]